MKTLLALAVGAVPLLAPALLWHTNGNMRNGGGWGHGLDGWIRRDRGIWGRILLVVVVVGVAVLVVQRKGK